MAACRSAVDQHPGTPTHRAPEKAGRDPRRFSGGGSDRPAAASTQRGEAAAGTRLDVWESSPRLASAISPPEAAVPKNKPALLTRLASISGVRNSVSAQHGRGPASRRHIRLSASQNYARYHIQWSGRDCPC